MASEFARSSSQYLSSIDAEIQRLHTLREQVASAIAADPASAKPTIPAKAARKGMSEEGRRRIARAQKARWAKQKSAAKSSIQNATAKKTVQQKAGKSRPATTKGVAKKSTSVKTVE